MRTWLESDALFLFELNNDNAVVQYTGDVAFESLQKAKYFVENYKQFEAYGCGRWMIEDRETNEQIGWCGLKFHPETNEYDLGYRLKKQFWNRGIASRTSLMAIDFASYGLRIGNLYAIAMKENSASIRVLEKTGFIKTREEAKQGEIWYRFDLKI